MKHALSLLCVCGALICLLLAPSAAMDSAAYGLALYARLLLPSLYPFFVLSALLVRLGFPRLLGRLAAPAARLLWGISGQGVSALVAGLCGGYPLGAQTAAELYRAGEISREEAEFLLSFCNNTGPSFLIGVIGSGLFSSRGLGLRLYAIHALSALLAGIALRPRALPISARSSSEPGHIQESFSTALVASVHQAVTSVLYVGGFVVCFCVVTGMLEASGFVAVCSAALSKFSGLSSPFVRALLTGLLELSSGVGAMQSLVPGRDLFLLCAFLSGWGGLSVQFQTLAVLSDTDLNTRFLLPGRVLSALFSAFFAFLLYPA